MLFRSDGIADVRKFVQSGRWSGEVALTEPPENASNTEVNGRYGVAYLAIKRIADKYGEDKMLAFFDLAERQGRSLPKAAEGALGADWDQVAADCADYVKARI